MGFRIGETGPTQQPTNQQRIKTSVQKNEKHLESLFSRVDNSKVKSFAGMEDYHDKDGNYLYTRSQTAGGGTEISFRDVDDNDAIVKMRDRDNDGKFDFMSHSKHNYDAGDLDGDGSFDVAWDKESRSSIDLRY